MTGRVTATDAQVRRVTTESAMAEEWRRACDPMVTGVPKHELAENHLGMPRSKLYETFDGTRHPRLAWLDLLPEIARVTWLRGKALVLGYELVPVTTAHATLGDVVGEAGRVLASMSTSEADGHLSADEAARDLEAIEALEVQLGRAKALRRQAIEQRGCRVITGGKAR